MASPAVPCPRGPCLPALRNVAPEIVVWDLERLLLFRAAFFQDRKLLWVLPWGPDSSRVWRQTPC